MSDTSNKQRQQQINESLKAFNEDPLGFMNRQPVKKNSAGEVINAKSLFSEKNIEDKDYISVRDALRLSIVQKQQVNSTRAAFESNDMAESLVDKFRHSDLESIEAADLMAAKLDESPWSDDYWALYTGALGKRYADPDFPEADDWMANAKYIQENMPAPVMEGRSAAMINRLSPAEKYDALIGDDNYTLTRRMWNEGKYYHDAKGSVEPWMGICHGWAPAAYMMPRPTNSIIVKSGNGNFITFYPDDIKALASLLWAKVAPETRFIGGRCDDKEPEQDEIGRNTSVNCFDTNPGTWHLAVVNQIGVSRRSMVLDATYDYEVWNQPIFSYDYQYFNPETGEAVDTLEEAKVAMGDLTNDRFSDYRSLNTSSLVGIQMELSYVVETSPSQNEEDDPSRDSIDTVGYLYDLELDASGKVIGGEWYMNPHPDFLWTPPKGARAETRYDYLATGKWKKGKKVPKQWREAAKQASSSDSAPLAAIVERLIDLSRA